MKENRVNKYTELCTMLRSMRLSGMAEKLEEQGNNPNIDLKTSDERITESLKLSGICATTRSL